MQHQSLCLCDINKIMSLMIIMYSTFSRTEPEVIGTFLASVQKDKSSNMYPIMLKMNSYI